MITESIQNNSKTISAELAWFSEILNTRFNLYFGKETEHKSIYEIDAPEIDNNDSTYASIIKHYNMNFQERVILMLALVPHIAPQLLDVFFTKNANYDRGFTEFGGIRGHHHSGFLPTGETAAFLLAANNLEYRFSLANIFDRDHFFQKHRIVSLEKEKRDEPLLSGTLIISKEYLSYLTTGDSYKPDFSSEFPAKLIETNLEWKDLVLDDFVMRDIQEILAWLKHQDTIMNQWGMKKRLKRGYRALFYGPPGTGKTLTASLLGKETNLECYRIDLSQIVSKYIGETEKNMASIFDQAENKNWILFFDEADALFGKRTAASDSKDKHANQEVAYLLQRVEDFPGVVILATNLKSNIDEAFSRRFQSMIYFPVPDAEQRWSLWKKTFESEYSKLAADVNLEEIAYEHKLAGGAIINVLRYCMLMAVRDKNNEIHHEDILEGIRKELRKEGKTV